MNNPTIRILQEEFYINPKEDILQSEHKHMDIYLKVKDSEVSKESYLLITNGPYNPRKFLKGGQNMQK
jgi:hypothetical protein